MNKNTLSVIFAWVAVFLWGIHGPSGRYLAIEKIPILAVMSARFYIGAIIIFIYLIISKKFDKNIFKNIKNLFLLGFFGVFSNSIFYHLGLKFIPATLVMLLENMAPIFVFLMIIIIDRQKLNVYEIISLSISFIGLLFIVSGKGGLKISSSDFYIGISLELAAGITFGFYTYYSGKIIKYASFEAILNSIFVIFLIAGILSTPFLFEFKSINLKPLHIILILQMGIFQSGLAYVLWNYSISNLNSSKTSLYFYMTVVFTTINEIIFLNFKLNYIIIIGAVLIIGNSIYISIENKKKE